MLVDADPQGTLATALGIGGDKLSSILANLMYDVSQSKSANRADVTLTHAEGVGIIPSIYIYIKCIILFFKI